MSTSRTTKQDPAAQSGAEAELFPIRTVATLTGVNPITLRAWERRHGLVVPVRTESGHRMYTQRDIDIIHRIQALLEKGLAISQVAQQLGSGNRPNLKSVDDAPWSDYRRRLVAAIEQFDEDRLEDVYNEVHALYHTEVALRRVLLPLLQELGVRWRAQTGSIAEEHFFGVYLRNKLGARFHHRGRHNNGPRLLAACLPGEQHDVGLLLFALAAHDQGYRLVLLGSDMPLAEIIPAVQRARADALVLSGSIDPKAGLLDRALPELVRAVTVPVFVGGHTSIVHHDPILASGAVSLGVDIDAALKRIATTLAQWTPRPIASPKEGNAA